MTSVAQPAAPALPIEPIPRLKPSKSFVNPDPKVSKKKASTAKASIAPKLITILVGTILAKLALDILFSSDLKAPVLKSAHEMVVKAEELTKFNLTALTASPVFIQVLAPCLGLVVASVPLQLLPDDKTLVMAYIMLVTYFLGRFLQHSAY